MGRVKLSAALPRGQARSLWLAARPYAVVFAISTLIVSRWFRAGTFIATGDMGPWIRRGWEPEALFSWNHQITGAGSAGYTLARWADFLILRVVGALGGDEYIGQWVFYTLAYGLVAVGVAYCASALVHNEAAVIVAGSFGVLNGFFLTRLPNPLNIISVGSIALITGLALRVAQGRKFPLPLAGVVLWPTSFLAFNPPMLIVAYAWALGGTVLFSALILGWRAAGRLVRWLIGAAPWAILLNAWWIVPLAGGFTGGGGATANAEFTDPTSWTWAQINNVPQNVLTMVANWAWFRPQYLPFAADLDQPLIVWVRYLLPALAFLAPVLAVRQRRRLSLVLSGLMIIFVVLAKGLMPPFSQFNLFLYLHVPGFWLFREPMSKLGQLLVIFFALQLAVAVEGVWHTMRSQGGFRLAPWPVRLRTVGVIGAVCAVLAYPFPLWTGSVVPDSRPTQPSAHVRVPDFWRSMAQTVDADPRPGKVLVLPQDDYYQMPTTWGFFGVDSIANLLIRHPVVQRKPDGYFGDVPGFSANVQAIETALVSGDLEPVPKLLASVGASKIIIRHDLVRGLPGRHFADDRVLTAAAGRVPGLQRVVTGSLDLWTVGSGTAPTVSTFNRVLDAPSRPTAVASALGSADRKTALAARRPAGPASPDVEVDSSVSATDDVVEWPTPAVDSGAPTGSFTLRKAGTFSVAQRARAAAVLEPSVRGRKLVLHDPTTLRLDGAVVSRRPDTTVALPAGREVLAVTAGTRTVSLDGWSRGALPPARAGAASRPTVAVGSATDLVALARSLKPISVTPYSDVYDCNNYEPRPAAELGLVRTLGTSGGQASVRLRARDHAACSRVVITGVHPGQVLRVRLSYRQVSGKRPQVCIWQVGVSGCADTPRAQLAATWSPSEVFVKVAEGTRSVQVVLHADVGQRLLPQTVSEYRGLTVDALDPAVSTSVWPGATTSRTLALPAGPHTLTVAGGLSGSVLGDFEPLQDCFRTDDLTPAQAGVMSQTEGTGQATTYVLGARSHMACLGATVPDMGGASMYVLSLEARSLGLRNPKFCIYARGPDRCRTLPTAMSWKGWTPYSAVVQADPEAIETRLYLYGLRDLAEKRTSQVEYRQVRLRPVASPSTVVLVRQDSASTKTAGYTWRRANPTRFPATVTSTGGTVAALYETFAPGWAAPGISTRSEHVALQGWMNGWRVPAGRHTGAFSYTPEGRARLARLALPAGLVAAVVWIALARWWRRSRRRRRG